MIKFSKNTNCNAIKVSDMTIMELLSREASWNEVGEMVNL